MNALSHQIVGYLDLSEQGDKLARNNLCHLIKLLDRHYQHKIQRLDGQLLKRILYHLVNCDLNSFISIDKALYTKKIQQIKQLIQYELNTEELRKTAFNRCVYFANKLLEENQYKNKNSSFDSDMNVETDLSRSTINPENDNNDDFDTEINIRPW